MYDAAIIIINHAVNVYSFFLFTKENYITHTSSNRKRSYSSNEYEQAAKAKANGKGERQLQPNINRSSCSGTIFLLFDCNQILIKEVAQEQHFALHVHSSEAGRNPLSMQTEWQGGKPVHLTLKVPHRSPIISNLRHFLHICIFSICMKETSCR